VTNVEIGAPQFLDGVRVLLPLARTLFILNMNTLDIEGRFEDVLPADSDVAVVCSQRQGNVSVNPPLP
jgi:hypothetical protein